MPTTVVHVNDPDGWDVYIGRATPRAKNPEAHLDSKYRNPYKRGIPHPVTGQPMTKQDCIEHFRDTLNGEGIGLLDFIMQPGFKEDARALRGKRIACWCAGKDGAPRELTGDSPKPYVCHGQVWAALADKAGM